MLELLSRTLFDKDIRGLERISANRGWTVFDTSYPVLDVGFTGHNKDMRIRMICDNWNELPPSVELLSLKGEYLKTVNRDPAGVFNNSIHAMTGRPFICMVGSREYHTHESHTSDHWADHSHKSGYDLGGILTQIWRAWEKVQG